MKSLRCISVLVMSLASMAFAQSDVHKHAAQKPEAPKSEAQISFDKLKTLTGTWEGKVTTDMPLATEEMSKAPMHVVIRGTSRGNALLHEMTSGNSPDDPITMMYLDNDNSRLLLTHYCDAGNRPRMAGKTSPDGKSVQFDFIDISGKNLSQHMQQSAFNIIDDNHHTEDWLFMIGDKPVHAHFDLKRVATTASK